MIYLVLSLAFLASGLKLINALKAYFGKFYKQISKAIWFATLFLSLTLFVRAALNIVRYVDSSGLDDAIDESLEENTLFAPLYDTFLYVMSDLFPQVAQLLSLVFGLIRKRQHDAIGLKLNRATSSQKKEESDNSELYEEGAQSTPIHRQGSFFDDVSMKSSFFDPPVEDYQLTDS